MPASPTDTESVVVTIDGSVARIRLDRPAHRNALDAATIASVTAALQRIDAAPEVRVALLEGSGRSFCAGADLLQFGQLVTRDPAPSRDELRGLAKAGEQMVLALVGCSKITVAAVQGHAVGGGMLLAAGCDLRVADAQAVFAIPEIALGLPLAWLGVPLLNRELGTSRARDLILTGRRVAAPELAAAGFVHRLADRPADVAAAVDALVEELGRGAEIALHLSKRQACDTPLATAEQCRRDREYFVDALLDPGFLPAAMRYVGRINATRSGG